MGCEFETELCGKRGRLQITHFASTNSVRYSLMIKQATKAVGSEFSRGLLRGEGAAVPMETPIWGKFREFPKAKPNVCVFSTFNDSAIL